MKFDCPRCGELIDTSRTVGEFINCDNCNAYLKILTEDVAAVFSGEESKSPGSASEAKSAEAENSELIAAAAEVEGEDPKDDADIQYYCPNCYLPVITDGAPGAAIICENCRAELSIASDASAAPNPSPEESIPKDRLTVQSRPQVLKSDSTSQEVLKDVPKENGDDEPAPPVLEFVCPQCSHNVQTRRAVGQMIKCCQCGSNLKIIAPDTVALVLGEEEPERHGRESKKPPPKTEINRYRHRSASSRKYGLNPTKLKPVPHVENAGGRPQHTAASTGKFLKTIGCCRRVIVDVAAIGAVLLAVAFFVSEMRRDIVAVLPFDVPEDIENIGYSPEVVSGRVIDRIHFITENALINYSSAGFPVLEQPEPEPEIILAAGGPAFPGLTDSWRRFLGNRSIKINGEMTGNESLLCFTVRVAGFGENNSARRDIYGTLTDIDLIFNEAARFIMEMTRPRTLAACMYDDSRVGYDFRVALPAPPEAINRLDAPPSHPNTDLETLIERLRSDADKSTGQADAVSPDAG